MEVQYHPLFERWLTELADGDEEIFGEVMALHRRPRTTRSRARRRDPRRIAPDRQLPLRPTRTPPDPPTQSTPYATGPPVLRVIYGYCARPDGANVAIVLIGGDKTTLGNHWYRPNIAESQTRLEQYTRQHTELTAIVKRGNR